MGLHVSGLLISHCLSWCLSLSRFLSHGVSLPLTASLSLGFNCPSPTSSWLRRELPGLTPKAPPAICLWPQSCSFEVAG